MEDFEPVSDSEKLAIATHLLLSSPPGEIMDVLGGKRARCTQPVYGTSFVLGNGLVSWWIWLVEEECFCVYHTGGC